MRIAYKEAKRRAGKERDIWMRKLICNPITTPLAYLLARFTSVQPLFVTALTFLTGIAAAGSFLRGHLVGGAVLYATSLLLDSLDGKLNRVLGRDDTYRGIIDFILDGVVCATVTVSIAWYSGDFLLTVMLLGWMSLHYLDMRYTSAAYRLKAQTGDTNVWLITESNRGWILRTYGWFVRKFHTYPHPTVGEAVVLMFVVGPILWARTENITFENLAVVLGIVCTIPETIGAGIIAYKLVKKES